MSYGRKVEHLVVSVSIASIVVTRLGVAAAAPFAYVPNTLDFSVSIIDTATNTVVATPKIGVEFDEPTALAATPDAKRVYVVGDSPAGPVWIIDTTTQTTMMPGKPSFTVGDQLKAIAITPDGLAYYVVEGAVAIGDTAHGDADAGMITFAQGGPSALTRIATSSDGTRMYLSDSFTDGVWAVNTAAKTGDLLDTFTHECAISTVTGPCVTDADCPSGFCDTASVLASPLGLAVGADGRYLYVANHFSTAVTILDTTSRHCQAGNRQNMTCSALPDAASPDCPGAGPACLHGFCPCTNVVTSVTPTEFGNNAVLVAPDGKHVYTAGDGGTISIIDTSTNTLTGAIPNDQAGQLFDLAITPDGGQLYAVDVTTEKVWVIATATNTVTTSIPVGSEPRAILIPVVRAAPKKSCGGDCGGDGQVTISEIITMVNITLGSADIGACRPGDTNNDNQITINEIIAAVADVLNGCPT